MVVALVPGQATASPPSYAAARSSEARKAKTRDTARSKRPPWDQVEGVARSHFAGFAGLQPGDIISRNQVAPLLEELKRNGWQVPAAGALLDLVHGESDFIVRQLRTDNGRRFMRKLSTDPKGYDRLDRLSEISGGRQIIVDLIREPGGQRLIEYLTSSQGGRNLSKELTRVPGGRNFDKPTGRLYTVQDLLGELAARYAAGESR